MASHIMRGNRELHYSLFIYINGWEHKREAAEKFDASRGSSALFGDEDTKQVAAIFTFLLTSCFFLTLSFDLQLENFGLNWQSLKVMVPQHTFCNGWKNGSMLPLRKMILLQRYSCWRWTRILSSLIPIQRRLTRSNLGIRRISEQAVTMY